MKMATEWALDLFTPLRRETDDHPYTRCDELNARVIQQIQLDAVREGLQRAAKIAWVKEYRGRGAEMAITEAANNLSLGDL